ncbi:hypothetical protein UlMin_043751 [Ulmus minor]
MHTTRTVLNSLQQSPNPDDMERDKNLRLHLDHLLKMEEILWFQKSRLKWHLDRDRCTRFFFLTTLSKRKHNRIDCIKSEDEQWLSSRNQIGQAFKQRFIDTYDEPPFPHDMDLSHLISPNILESDNEKLIRIPDYEDIRATTLWLRCMIFFITRTLYSYISNIVLIPKSQNPTKVNHFRPIVVCNVIYKVIFKLLTDRVKPLLSQLICPTQNAFECLDDFCHWSGQSFNPQKSNIFFNAAANRQTANLISAMMGFSRINPNSPYLGLPLFRSGRTRDFSFILENLDSKLAAWKAKTLSRAKKLILIKSIALTLPIYAMQTIKLPASVCSKLDARIRSF